MVGEKVREKIKGANFQIGRKFKFRILERGISISAGGSMRRLLSHRFVTTSIYVETDIFNISKQNYVY